MSKRGNATGVAQDAAVASRGREELHRLECDFREVLGALPAAVYITDADGRVTHYNQAAAELAGRTPELGIDRWCIAWKLYRVDGTPMPHDECPMATALKEGRAVRNVELCVEQPGGRRRFVAPSPTPLKDASGRVVGGVNLVLDVTDLRQAQEELLACERLLANRTEQFATLFDRAPLGIFFVDADFVLREINPIALHAFGDVRGGIVGRDFGEIAHVLWNADYADEVCRQFWHTLATGEPYVAAECVELRADRGVTEYNERRLERVRLADGLDGVACYFRDVSGEVLARRAIETTSRALADADRRKDEFLATLSHELRNPLAPLRTGVDLLGRAGHKSEVVDRVREMMDRQLAHLGRLVDDLLDVSRISRGSVTLRLADLDLRTVIQAAVELTNPVIAEYRHELLLSLGDIPLPIRGDFARLVQVVGNLLSNAAKYGGVGGTITVRADANGGSARLAVCDTGFGIPAASLKSLFEMFTQLPAHREMTGGGGLGIGLALARQLVQLHGGSIVAHSDGVGCGSEFVVELPLAPGAVRAAPAQATSSARRTTATTVRRRLVVVDDNVDASDALCMLLELQGHTAEAFYDGPSALRAIERSAPDVVLLDIGLPGMDGYEVARRIRAQSWGRTLTLCALTGWGQPADKECAYAAGFDRHLTKPLTLETLQSVLDGLGENDSVRMPNRSRSEADASSARA